MDIQTYSCNRCGMRFQVICRSELDEKLKKHVCHKPNKKVARTKEIKQNMMRSVVQDRAVNRIERHNFERLVERGMIVKV